MTLGPVLPSGEASAPSFNRDSVLIGTYNIGFTGSPDSTYYSVPDYLAENNTTFGVRLIKNELQMDSKADLYIHKNGGRPVNYECFFNGTRTTGLLSNASPDLLTNISGDKSHRMFDIIAWTDKDSQVARYTFSVFISGDNAYIRCVNTYNHEIE